MPYRKYDTDILFHILSENLPNMDMILTDKNLNILLALGKEIRERGWATPVFPRGTLSDTLSAEIYDKNLKFL